MQNSTVPPDALHRSYTVPQTFCTIPTLFLPPVPSIADMSENVRNFEAFCKNGCPRYTTTFYDCGLPPLTMRFAPFLHCPYTVPTVFCTVPAPFGTVLFCLLLSILDPSLRQDFWPPPAASGRNMRLHPPASGRSLVYIQHPAAGQTPLSQKQKYTLLVEQRGRLLYRSRQLRQFSYGPFGMASHFG